MLSNIKPKRTEKILPRGLSQLSNDDSEEYCPQVSLPQNSPHESDTEFPDLYQKTPKPIKTNLDNEYYVDSLLNVPDVLGSNDITKFKDAKLISMAKKVLCSRINLILDS
jgi:hypothetical protein